jgi:CRP-like cAMP-binding protein
MNNHNKIFGELSTIEKFKKKEIILEQGKVENHLSYLIKGSVAVLTYHNGNEICINFCIENSFFSSYVSFLTREPSTYYILAMEDTIIERIDYESLESAYSISANHQKNGRKIVEQLYIKSNKRILSLITKTAEERYIEFIEEHSNFLQHIPLKYLASYLGITPVSLSRLRNKILKS